LDGYRWFSLILALNMHSIGTQNEHNECPNIKSMDHIHGTIEIYVDNSNWWKTLKSTTNYEQVFVKFYSQITKNIPFLIRKF
jgi:hypothetical protein